MENIINPILECSVIIPGIFLAYLPMRNCLKHSVSRLLIWMCPLLLSSSVLGGIFCYYLNMPTILFLFPLLVGLMFLYHHTLHTSIWKSGSIFLAICAVFACINSFIRCLNAIFTAHQNLTEIPLWFCTRAGVIYNLICWIFVLIVLYPASHSVRTMIDNDNFAQTWYVFWFVPLLFICLNIFMVPKYRQTLYTGRILQGYIVISLVLLIILALFYAMFFLMAVNLNRNAKLQQENHFLALQQERYDNLCNAIEETRHARHDLRHHFLQLSSLAEQGDLEKIKSYLYTASSKIPDMNMHFCDNRAADSIVSYYYSLAQRENIPIQAQIDLPEHIGPDEMDVCLILSNLLENALEASLRMEPSKRNIEICTYMQSPYLLLIYIENAFEGEVQEHSGLFRSSKRHGNGIGIQSVKHMIEKNGGMNTFSYENNIFTAKIIYRINTDT